MKRTLLELVQSILNDMDSEQVNSIDDSVEALQIASVIEDTYYNLISNRHIPEHSRLINLTSLSDNTRPTHFKYPTGTKQLDLVEYNVATDGTWEYKEIEFVEPLIFLTRQPSSSDTNVVEVTDVNSTAKIFVYDNEMPSFYTSFDDEHIVMNSYDSSVEVILAASKTRAFGTMYPTFTVSDSFTPDIDDNLFPYLLAEAKSTCFSLFKAGADPKIEQAAKRLKSYTQNDMYRTKRPNIRNHYGRY